MITHHSTTETKYASNDTNPHTKQNINVIMGKELYLKVIKLRDQKRYLFPTKHIAK